MSKLLFGMSSGCCNLLLLVKVSNRINFALSVSLSNLFIYLAGTADIVYVFNIYIRCTDGCGAFCHVCDYEHHKMKPMHVRNATVKYRCFMCSNTAETR